jgi:2-polyprenyl-3-methyl-5-hydroxy-6-metoxy-1,4-benzoquinol methylase
MAGCLVLNGVLTERPSGTLRGPSGAEGRAQNDRSQAVEVNRRQSAKLGGGRAATETGVTKRNCDFCGAEGRLYARGDGFDVLACERCRLLWTNPVASQSASDDYMERVGEVYQANVKAQKERFRGQLEICIREAGLGDPRGLRILEVGAGLGFFLEVCEEFGISAEGCDIDRGRVESANKQRVRVRLGTLDDSYGDATFDAVFAFNLIEHLTSPREFLVHAGRVLRTGGVLVIETPIQESVLHRLAHIGCALSRSRVNFLAVNPGGHNYKFSRKTFEVICGEIGFSLVRQENVSSPFAEIWGKSGAISLRHKLLYRLALPPAWALGEALGQGNRLFVIMRKR